MFLVGCGGGGGKDVVDVDGGAPTLFPDGGGSRDTSISGPDSGAAGQEAVLFKMESVQGVSRNPPNPTTFTLSHAAYVTRVWTYHYNAAIAGTNATVAFMDTVSGAVYGPWTQIGYTSFAGALGAPQSDPGNVVGPPDNYRMAYPGQSVPAGTYQVVDSDSATWCYTADTGNRGLTWVYGWYGPAPAPSVDAAADVAADASVVETGQAIDTRPGPVLIGTVTQGLSAAAHHADLAGDVDLRRGRQLRLR